MTDDGGRRAAGMASPTGLAIQPFEDLGDGTDVPVLADRR